MNEKFSVILQLWDIQQEYYHRYRDDRYEAMFDLLAVSGRKKFRILDLASGPGSLSLRFLKRFPGSESVMVDQDPVLLRLSREVFAEVNENHTWIETDITGSNWTDKLEPGSFDAVMSTTALHWVDEAGFSKICRHAHHLLRKGGFFINGDTIHADSDSEEFFDLEEETRSMHAGVNSGDQGFDWDAFWDLIRKTPELSDEIARRDVIYPPGTSHGHPVTLQMQSDFLRNAGFNVLGVIWSRFSDRVLAAIK